MIASDSTSWIMHSTERIRFGSGVGVVDVGICVKEIFLGDGARSMLADGDLTRRVYT